MAVQVQEGQVVEISGILHYSISHNHIMVLGCKTLEMII